VCVEICWIDGGGGGGGQTVFVRGLVFRIYFMKVIFDIRTRLLDPDWFLFSMYMCIDS